MKHEPERAARPAQKPQASSPLFLQFDAAAAEQESCGDADEPEPLHDDLALTEAEADAEWAAFRHASAFASCIHGGSSAYVWQSTFGGDDELLIQGAGFWLASRFPDDPFPRRRVKPLVYCDPRLVDEIEGRLLPAARFQKLLSYLRFVTGGEEPPDELVVIGTPRAVEHWTTGTTVLGDRPGQLGPACTVDGTSAVLTAGHVSGGQKSVLVNSSSAKVLREFHAGTSSIPLSIGPDYAAIELPQGATATRLVPRSVSAGPNEPMKMASTGATGQVLAYATFMRVANRPGCWGRVYQLDSKIGVAGQSGNAVVDSAGALTGLYLGELGSRWAIVQDIVYLVDELNRAKTVIP